VIIGGVGLSGVAAQAAGTATQPDWTSAQRAGGSGSDDGNAITANGAGAPIVAGNFRGTAYFPKSATADDSIALTATDDSQDIFLAGMNASGTYFAWARRAGGPA
jgi:hypothetical protein